MELIALVELQYTIKVKHIYPRISKETIKIDMENVDAEVAYELKARRFLT